MYSTNIVLYSTYIVFVFVFQKYCFCICIPQILYLYLYFTNIVFSYDALLTLQIASFHTLITDVCLVLVQPRMIRPDMIEELLTGT